MFLNRNLHIYEARLKQLFHWMDNRHECNLLHSPVGYMSNYQYAIYYGTTASNNNHYDKFSGHDNSHHNHDTTSWNKPCILYQFKQQKQLVFHSNIHQYLLLRHTHYMFYLLICSVLLSNNYPWTVSSCEQVLNFLSPINAGYAIKPITAFQQSAYYHFSISFNSKSPHM